MRKKWKKMFIVNLVVILSAGALNIQANGEMDIRNYPEWQEVYENYLEDEMFLLHLEDDYESALFMIDTIVEAQLRTSTYAGPMREPNCVVPEIMQCKDYYCGPASTLQCIYGFGKEDMVSGSGYNAKQRTLAANLGTTETNQTTIVYDIMVELNKYIDDTEYSYIAGVNISDSDEFASKISNSLFNDRPVILHALTGSLDYYEGEEIRHYIVVDTYYATEMASGPAQHMRLVDCNNSDKDKDGVYERFGVHVEPVGNVFNTINRRDENGNARYLIYAP